MYGSGQGEQVMEDKGSSHLKEGSSLFKDKVEIPDTAAVLG